MASNAASRSEVLETLFNITADTIIAKLKSEDGCHPDWAKCAISFLRENGGFSQLPVPGSKVAEVSNSLPFKKAN